MTNLRVCVIAYHSSPLAEPGSGDAGGMTVYVRELAAALAAQGVTTDVFTRATGDGPRLVELGPNVRVISVDAGPRAPVAKERLRRHLSEFVDGVRAFAVAQRVGYSVIHSHYWQSGLAAKALSGRWGAPNVHSHHTLARVKNRWLAPGDSPEPDSRLTGEQEVIDSADVLVASTGEEWEHLKGLYGAAPERLKIVYPGVDHELFNPGDRAEARRALGLPAGPLLVAVGRVQRLKGFDLAIDGLARMEDRRTRLVIVGGASGPFGELEVRRLNDRATRLGVADRIVWAGAQPHRRLPLYYRAADALCVCSYSESFGLTALEAQSCGVPIVGAAVGAIPDLIADGGSGILLRDRDPATFASAAGQILDDPVRAAAMATAGRQRALRFSWKTTAEDFLELYECLIRESSPESCTC